MKYMGHEGVLYSTVCIAAHYVGGLPHDFCDAMSDEACGEPCQLP